MKSVFGLLGRHLSHSYSKPIHEALGGENYELIEVEPSDLEAFFKTSDVRGLNVTIPYKKDVFPYLDEVSREAQEIGSVNTIAPSKEGRLIGYNTDAFGFSMTVKRKGISLENKKVLILGSGGASLAVKWVLKNEGARECVTVSRSGEDNYENISRHFDADIIVNATPVGMFPNCEGSLITLREFKRLEGVFDLIYNPSRTNLLVEAERLSIPYSNGLPMLVYQAKMAEEIFTGEKIDDFLAEALIQKLSADMTSIVLVGMPCSGKSTVGKSLATLSKKEVVDIDDEIVKTAGMSIPEIFEAFGEERFRELEACEIKKASMRRGVIIVTGGGAVKREENFLPLKRCGRIYHLEREISSLARDGRPLSKGADLEKMYEERLPLYEKFRDAEVRVLNDPDDTAKEIWRDFYENSCY